MKEQRIKLVLDANAFIGHPDDIKNLRLIYDLVVTPEVIQELRDGAARESFKLLKSFMKKKKGSEDSRVQVRKFAKKTGDLPRLSEQDIGVIAAGVDLIRKRGKAHLLYKRPKRMRNQFGKKNKKKKKKNKKKKEKEKENDVKNKKDDQDLVDEKTADEKNVDEKNVDEKVADEKIIDEKNIKTLKNEEKIENVEDNKTLEKDKILESNEVKTENNNDSQEKVDNMVPEAKEKTIESTIIPPKTNEPSTSDNQPKTFKKDIDKYCDGWVKDSIETNPECNDYSGGWLGPQNIGKLNTKQGEDSSNRLKEIGIGIVTSDFAMQNVLLQMGLPLLSLDGSVISRLKSYILECFSCGKMDKDCSKQFCDKCGKNTLSRVTCEYDDKGKLILYRKKNYQPKKRGTRFNIPNPKGGRRIDDLLLTKDSFDQPKVISYLRKHKNYKKKQVKKMEIDWDLGFGFETGKEKRKQFHDLEIGYGRKNPNVNAFWKNKRKK